MANVTGTVVPLFRTKMLITRMCLCYCAYCFLSDHLKTHKIINHYEHLPSHGRFLHPKQQCHHPVTGLQKQTGIRRILSV